MNLLSLCIACQYETLIDILKKSTSTSEFVAELENTNNGYAFWFLGVIYEEGIVVDKNIKKAMSYFEKAANLGDAGAMIDLADKYEDQEDEKSALIWYEKAGENRHINGMYGAGTIYAARYLEGKGDHNLPLAVKWLTKAKKDPDCLWELGELLLNQNKFLAAMAHYSKSILYKIISLFNKPDCYVS